ncbi:MAG: hypothetical protein NTW09_03195, partial [Candidatus Omnitrophica bacterium]|nr:hypothetical protein [Candidatus Omnitrophota bacterium]
IEILLGLVIVSFLFYMMLKLYFKGPQVDKGMSKTLSEQGIDTKNYKTFLDTTRQKLKNIEKQQAARQKEAEELR